MWSISWTSPEAPAPPPSGSSQRTERGPRRVGQDRHQQDRELRRFEDAGLFVDLEPCPFGQALADRGPDEVTALVPMVEIVTTDRLPPDATVASPANHRSREPRRAENQVHRPAVPEPVHRH